MNTAIRLLERLPLSSPAGESPGYGGWADSGSPNGCPDRAVPSDCPTDSMTTVRDVWASSGEPWCDISLVR
jgi:hypothetical protein